MIILNKNLSKLIYTIVLVLALGYLMSCDTMEEETIMTKEEIITVFETNYEKFDTVQKFISEGTGEYYFYTHRVANTREILFKNNAKEVEIKNKKIFRSLLFIIDDLEFRQISEGENDIIFVKDSGSFSQGIMYLESHSMPVFVRESKKITDNWWYYNSIVE
ncbi:hypothetical protein RBH29_17510 [Herbivorax sp. ANBcel31]|uniref:hypothetical protein n=1 Tax=Herbivorax sp. ANBcel31 TaxID=3069754 RepID=UPI0027ADF056|nr:hypothetical protein [Herbivorax sp. ANBcel31]MDQ2088224.1 hypothetical protein [Herbivorax sp. ANBcel31]